MNGFKRRSLCISLVALMCVLLTPSCENDFETSIPYVYVNFRVNLINNNDLTVPGNAVYFGAGYGGVVVIYNGIGYYAYDAACPYEIDPAIRIEVESGIGTCPVCGSQYNLWEGGYVTKGPSSEPLKQYHVSVADNALIITN